MVGLSAWNAICHAGRMHVGVSVSVSVSDMRERLHQRAPWMGVAAKARTEACKVL
jgi:hypothetical protein